MRRRYHEGRDRAPLPQEKNRVRGLFFVRKLGRSLPVSPSRNGTFFCNVVSAALDLTWFAELENSCFKGFRLVSESETTRLHVEGLALGGGAKSH